MKEKIVILLALIAFLGVSGFMGYLFWNIKVYEGEVAFTDIGNLTQFVKAADENGFDVQVSAHSPLVVTYYGEVEGFSHVSDSWTYEAGHPSLLYHILAFTLAPLLGALASLIAALMGSGFLGFKFSFLDHP